MALLVGRAGSTPPPTPVQATEGDAAEKFEQTAVYVNVPDDWIVDAQRAAQSGYPLSMAHGQPPMERHLLPHLAAPRDEIPPPALPTLYFTPPPFWGEPPAGLVRFAAMPQTVQVFTFTATATNEQPTAPPSTGSAVVVGGSHSGAVTAREHEDASASAEASVETSPAGHTEPQGQLLRDASSQPVPWWALFPHLPRSPCCRLTSNRLLQHRAARTRAN